MAAVLERTKKIIDKLEWSTSSIGIIRLVARGLILNK